MKKEDFETIPNPGMSDENFKYSSLEIKLFKELITELGDLSYDIAKADLLLMDDDYDDKERGYWQAKATIARYEREQKIKELTEKFAKKFPGYTMRAIEEENLKTIKSLCGINRDLG